MGRRAARALRGNARLAMLRELGIRNLAVVEDTAIHFGEGLNILTGSTGAGKSLILSAVDLLSGTRAKKSLIRRGSGELQVEGIFSVPRGWALGGDFGMDAGEEEISIRREITVRGRSRIWINGRIATSSAAREVTGSLIELHGQRRQQELLDQGTHIEYLDTWGDYGDLLADCMERIESYKELCTRLDGLEAEDHEHRKQEDFLRFQLRELEELRLEPGIDYELEKRIKRRENSLRFTAALDEARSNLSEQEGSVLERLSRVGRSLSSLTSIDDSWEGAASELEGARLTVQEISREIGKALLEIQEEPGDLELLQARLAAIQAASRKHKLDSAGLVEKMKDLRKIIADLENGSDEIIETRNDIERARSELLPPLEKLSRRRRSCAGLLEKEVTKELERLKMKGALFEVRLERPENRTFHEKGDRLILNPMGWDRVEFMIRTNTGESIHPLCDVVSGGELSRITLVLKKLQFKERKIPTLIFDEIDTGLGADIGGVVAENLAELATRYQVICITHLPQIAAKAAQHISVRKGVTGGRTTTSAAVLRGDERVAELARMLGGKGELRERLAAELLENEKGARSSAG